MREMGALQVTQVTLTVVLVALSVEGLKFVPYPTSVRHNNPSKQEAHNAAVNKILRTSGRRLVPDSALDWEDYTYINNFDDIGSYYRVSLQNSTFASGKSYMEDMGLTQSNMTEMLDLTSTVDLGMNFTFFDTVFDKACVSTNGWVTFCDNECPSDYWTDLGMTRAVWDAPWFIPVNQSDSMEPMLLPMIAIFWSDLQRGEQSTVSYAIGTTPTDGSQYFLLKYDDMSLSQMDNYTYSFELKLNCWQDGSCDFEMRHLNMSNFLDSVPYVSGFQSVYGQEGGTFELTRPNNEVLVSMKAQPNYTMTCEQLQAGGGNDSYTYYSNSTDYYNYASYGNSFVETEYVEIGDKIGSYYTVTGEHYIDHDEDLSLFDRLGFNDTDINVQVLFSNQEDDASAHVDLGFPAVIFGGSYSTVCVSTNGIITLCDSECNSYYWSQYQRVTYMPAYAFPTSESSDPTDSSFTATAIAPFWADLMLVEKSALLFATGQVDSGGNLTDYAIFRFEDFAFIGQADTSRVTAEVLLSCNHQDEQSGVESCDISFMYLNLTNPYNSHILAGIQGDNGTAGGTINIPEGGFYEVHINMTEPPSIPEYCDLNVSTSISSVFPSTSMGYNSSSTANYLQNSLSWNLSLANSESSKCNIYPLKYCLTYSVVDFEYCLDMEDDDAFLPPGFTTTLSDAPSNDWIWYFGVSQDSSVLGKDHTLIYTTGEYESSTNGVKYSLSSASMDGNLAVGYEADVDTDAMTVAFTISISTRDGVDCGIDYIDFLGNSSYNYSSSTGTTGSYSFGDGSYFFNQSSSDWQPLGNLSMSTTSWFPESNGSSSSGS